MIGWYPFCNSLSYFVHGGYIMYNYGDLICLQKGSSVGLHSSIRRISLSLFARARTVSTCGGFIIALRHVNKSFAFTLFTYFAKLNLQIIGNVRNYGGLCLICIKVAL